MFLTVLRHVPIWVFGLLLALIAFGVSQAVPRSVTRQRSMVLPLVLLALSFAGVVSAFGLLPLPAWATGVAAAVLLLRGRFDVSAVRFSAATQRFQVPGSWLPLGLMMAIFALKFGVGMSLALHPELRQSAVFVLAVSTAYGVFSGVFLARSMSLWAVARSTVSQGA